MLKRLIVNTSTNFALRIFNTILSIVSVPVIVNSVGEESYGIILLAGSVLGYFNLLDGGVPAGVVKYVAEFKAKDNLVKINQVITTSGVIFLGLGSFVALSLFIFININGLSLFNISGSNLPAAQNILRIAAIIAIFKWPFGVLEQSINGLQKYAENNLYKCFSEIISKGAAILAAVYGFQVEVIFFFRSISGILPVPLQYLLLKRTISEWSFGYSYFNRSTLKMIFGYSSWMLLSKISTLLIYQTDRIIISIFLPVSSLTVYRIVTIPFEFIKQMSNMFNSALTPAISSEYAKGGKKKISKFIYTLSSYSNSFVAPLALTGTILSAPFISLWMGPEYVEYAWIAQIACVFQLVWQMNASLGQVFYGSGIVKEVTLIAIFGAIINVPLGIILVKNIGVAGVVFSTIAAGVISVPLQYIFAMPKLDINRKKYLISVIKGQIPHWLLSILMFLFWVYFQNIDSWISLISVAVIMAAIFYSIAWFLVVQKNHKDRFYSFIMTKIDKNG